MVKNKRKNTDSSGMKKVTNGKVTMKSSKEKSKQIKNGAALKNKILVEQSNSVASKVTTSKEFSKSSVDIKSQGERLNRFLHRKKRKLNQALSEKSDSVTSVPGKEPKPPDEVKSDSAMTPNSDVKDNKRATLKRKKSKKSHDGFSNWRSLCSTLEIDPTRKKQPFKSPEEIGKKEESPPEAKKAKPEVWFDNVDKIFIEGDLQERTEGDFEAKDNDTSTSLVKPGSYKGETQCVAMDCEMVGVGPRGEESILARVSLVNHYGVCLYDKFVLPREKVTDYRTHVSGVTRENLKTGEEFSKVQKEVSDIIKGKVLVGHALHNDLKVLFLTHPYKMIRDTSKYKQFRQLMKGGTPSLKKLSEKLLGVAVQEGQHSPVQDAQAAMRLYTMHRQRWEKELKLAWKSDRKNQKKKKKMSKEKEKPTTGS